MHATMKELSDRLDMSPIDLLDACITAGVRLFHHNGQRFHDPGYLRTYLRMEWAIDLTPDVEVTLSDEQIEGVAAALGVECGEVMYGEVRS